MGGREERWVGTVFPVLVFIFEAQAPLTQGGDASKVGPQTGDAHKFTGKCTRMLSLLLESDADSTVSLEIFEDLGVPAGDATVASQAKQQPRLDLEFRHLDPRKEVR